MVWVCVGTAGKTNQTAVYAATHPQESHRTDIFTHQARCGLTYLATIRVKLKRKCDLKLLNLPANATEDANYQALEVLRVEMRLSGHA